VDRNDPRILRAQEHYAAMKDILQDVYQDGYEDAKKELAAIKYQANYFIVEFEENWRKGRVSIDCKGACNGLKELLRG
jgi:hypothetical protein